MPRLFDFRKHLLLEAVAAIGGVERIERHLYRVEGVAQPDHFQVNCRVFVAGEADEARLALLLGLVEGLQHAALGVGKFGVVVEGDIVDLPEVEVVGLVAAQRLLEHLHAQNGAAAVRADLGHEEDLVALTLQGRGPAILPRATTSIPRHCRRS